LRGRQGRKQQETSRQKITHMKLRRVRHKSVTRGEETQVAGSIEAGLARRMAAKIYYGAFQERWSLVSLMHTL